ncbi:hypothetical protein [Streptomyces lydicus]|uniref:hypothetical protein n=1 Tax=Streptomyces lydicus TaxID=47763 RepID=UPI003441EFD2
MDDVRRSVVVLAARFRDPHTARVRLPLGFTSWEAYCGAEFGISRAQAHRLLDVAHALIATSDPTDVGVELITGGRGSPPRPSSPTAPPGVGAALVSAVAQRGLVLVEDGGSVVLPLPADEVFQLGGIGETCDRAVCHVQLAADGSAAVAGFQQCVNGGVSGPDTVGEPVTGWPRRAGSLLGRCGFGGSPGSWFRHQDSQAPGVLGDAPLGGFAQVVPQMPPACDFDRLGRSGGGAFRDERRACRNDAVSGNTFIKSGQYAMFSEWGRLEEGESCGLGNAFRSSKRPVHLSRSASQGRPLPVGTPRANAGRVGETVCS